MSKKITHTRELEELIKNTIEVLGGNGDGEFFAEFEDDEFVARKIALPWA